MDPIRKNVRRRNDNLGINLHRQGGWWAAAASILGDILTQQGQKDTNANQTANMLQQEQWQEHMSDTAVTRRAADLKNANINPILAGLGQGASTGSTSLPNLQNPNSAFASLGNQVSNAMVTSAQIGNTRADTQNKVATTANIDADTNLKNVMKDTQGTQAELNRTQSAVFEQQINNMKAQLQLVDKQTTSAQQGIDQASKINDLIVQGQSIANHLAQLNVPGAEANARTWTGLGALGTTPTTAALKNVLMVLETLIRR